MNKKHIILSVLSIFLFSIIFGYSLVFAGSSKIEKRFLLSGNIIVDSVSLNQTSLLVESSSDLSKQKVIGDCNFYSRLPEKRKNFYMYQLKFFDDSCRGKILKIQSIDKQQQFFISFDILSEYEVYHRLLDQNNNNIAQLKKNLSEKIKQIQSKQKASNLSVHKTLMFKRNISELNWMISLLNNIQEKRAQKYSVPVAGKQIPTARNKIPNAGRPYRKAYTDGIHHGWDVDGKLGEQILSIDDAIVIRVVDSFENSDFSRIVYGNNLTYEQKLWNLDILRGKQVWLKTMKGDVVFYSHLHDIYDNIKEGMVVRKNQPIGTIGKSGVPGEHYDDFHIHFPIHKNPYNTKVGYTHSYEEYMKWDWYFKGKSAQYILEHQGEVFEN